MTIFKIKIELQLNIHYNYMFYCSISYRDMFIYIYIYNINMPFFLKFVKKKVDEIFFIKVINDIMPKVWEIDLLIAL